MSKLLVNVIPFHTHNKRVCANCDKTLCFGENNPCDQCLFSFECDIEDQATHYGTISDH